MLKKSDDSFNEDIRCKLQIVIEMLKLLKGSDFSITTIEKMEELNKLIISIIWRV